MKIKIQKTHPNAKIPTYGTDGAACFDLCIADGKWPSYDVGLAFEIPKGHYIEIHVRSSVGVKQDVRLANGTAIIDSDFRGSLRLFFTGTQAPFKVGDRVAQAMIKPYNRCSFQEVESLTKTKRGNGGVGSTGR